jgi:phosphoribosylaminoimidazole (AIR) synthetase
MDNFTNAYHRIEIPDTTKNYMEFPLTFTDSSLAYISNSKRYIGEDIITVQTYPIKENISSRLEWDAACTIVAAAIDRNIAVYSNNLEDLINTMQQTQKRSNGYEIVRKLDKFFVSKDFENQKIINGNGQWIDQKFMEELIIFYTKQLGGIILENKKNIVIATSSHGLDLIRLVRFDTPDFYEGGLVILSNKSTLIGFF